MSTEFLVLITAQAIGFAATIATLKAELRWIKHQLRDHENRLRTLEHGNSRQVELSELGI